MRSILFILMFCSLGLTGMLAQQTTRQVVLVKEHVFQELNAEQAFQLMNNSADLVVMDVRTPEEYDDGKIRDAVNVDFKAADFNEKIQALDKNKTYLLVCRSGARSQKAMDVMKSLGFNYLYHLKGGMLEWPKHQSHD